MLIISGVATPGPGGPGPGIRILIMLIIIKINNNFIYSDTCQVCLFVMAFQKVDRTEDYF